MRKYLNLSLFVALAIVFASCGTNNNVVSNSLLSKRKHNKGFYFNKKGNWKKSKDSKESESIAFNDEKQLKKTAEPRETSAKSYSHASHSRMPATDRVSATDELRAADKEFESANDYSTDSYGYIAEDQVDQTENTSRSTSKSNSVVSSETKHKKNKKKSSNSADGMFLLIVILTILIPFLGVAIYTNIDWMKTLICLLLTLLFYLPGLIYGFLVVFDVI